MGKLGESNSEVSEFSENFEFLTLPNKIMSLLGQILATSRGDWSTCLVCCGTQI